MVKTAYDSCYGVGVEYRKCVVEIKGETEDSWKPRLNGLSEEEVTVGGGRPVA